MVNLLKVQKTLLQLVAKQAGLRLQPVEVEPGTIISFWVPKEKAKCRKNVSTNKDVFPMGNSVGVENFRKEVKKKKERPAVVLVHGFATDGLVTWQFQLFALTKKYDVYVPDLLFFGGSLTSSTDRSPRFQAECMIAALAGLGVERCTVVGFSYGGFVAFRMAEIKPDMVHSLVISGSLIAMTDSMNESILETLGLESSAELLLPETAKGVKALLHNAMYKKLWFPNFMFNDFLEVMFSHKKERAELLEALVIRNDDANVPNLSQKILLLWGEKDRIFRLQYAKDMKEQLGENTSIQIIGKAGHLAHIERPFRYNHYLKEFLATAS
ncbi:alpha/beta-Hydrolases superfamily protein [Rhynchospora pubera]|uniref:Alpha/beta-Hydrolases superfamily protein n=1 Tax=Rhynchospora pubera TaxID=906938 RepID=A0AAV8ERM3_9POAL|nr:alpha/beta-Hydrolases superfamily protein [Rhynchospora pubera]